MDKNLRSSIVVAAIFVLGAVIQFTRGKTAFAIVGAVLGALYIVLTVIGYIKLKKQKQ